MLLNILLGFTIVGWVVALVWAYNKPSTAELSSSKSEGIADELQKLASLLEQGILTEEEFTKKKQQLLEKA